MSSLPDGRSIACPIRMSLNIFLIYNIYHLCCMCIDFYDLSTWGCCWFVVYIRSFNYLQIFKCVSFWLHGCCGKWEGWARKPVNQTSWLAVVIPADRPKSVRNHCVIEFFCGVVGGFSEFKGHPRRSTLRIGGNRRLCPFSVCCGGSLGGNCQ